MICFRRPSRGTDYDRPSGRGLLLPLFAALGILALTAALPKLFPAWLLRGRVQESANLRTTTQQVEQRQQVVILPGLMGLIDPHNGDNGTDPAQTTTDECTGDYSLPVLNGVDVVAYFSLDADAAPVYGTDSFMAVFGNYRFYFSSMENLQKFQAEPSTYLPAWGGFCSYGISNEPVWTAKTLGPFGDPAKWVIMPDGRLHMFRSSVPRVRFATDTEGNIERGNAVWLRWFGDAGGPLNTACICAETICDDQ